MGAGPTRCASTFSPCRAIDTEGEDIGEPGEIGWFPDRSYGGRTYIPAVARTTEGYELFGFVSFTERDRRSDQLRGHGRLHRRRRPRPTPTGSSTSTTT